MENILKILNIEIFFNPIKSYILILILMLLFIALKRYILNYIINILKNITDKTKTTLDGKLLKSLESPINILLIGLYFICIKNFINFSPNIKNIIDTSTTVLLHLAFFVFLYDIANIFTEDIKRFIKNTNKNIGKEISSFIVKSLKVIIFLLGLISVLNDLGFNISAFIASLGIGGLAFALAAKDTVSNLFGSFVIFTDKPFKVGDWIKTSSVEGVVEEIGIRSTLIRKFSQALVNIPNANIANEAITNWSKMGKRRIKMEVGLNYSTNHKQMKNILKELKTMLQEDLNIHNDTIIVNFTDFKDSSLAIFCYFFTNTTNWKEYMDVKEDINLKIMEIVQKNKASFAFPSRTIYITKEEQ